MKYLLVLLVIVIAVGIWRSRRRAENLEAQRPPPGKHLQPPQDMVACARCGLHLPRSDALMLGASPRAEYYCSAEHRAQGPA